MTEPTATWIDPATVPRWAPLHGANALEAFGRFWRKAFDWSGRASRSEYWWAMLIVGVLTFVSACLPGLSLLLLTDGQPSDDLPPVFPVLVVLTLTWWVVQIPPQLALLARRLHDVNLSGWMMLLGFVPFGSVAVFVMTVLPSRPEGARFDRPRA